MDTATILYTTPTMYKIAAPGIIRCDNGTDSTTMNTTLSPHHQQFLTNRLLLTESMRQKAMDQLYATVQEFVALETNLKLQSTTHILSLEEVQELVRTERLRKQLLDLFHYNNDNIDYEFTIKLTQTQPNSLDIAVNPIQG